MTALEKAESALHRSGSVMDTGAAFPPDFRPWPRTSGPWSPTASRPVIAGVEATGEVLEAGQGVALTPGTRVTVFLVDGAWRQEITMDTELAVPVSDSHPDEIAAQMLVNPVTVLMLRRAAQQHFSVGFDGVVLNNAAASAVGRLFTAGAQPPPDRHHQHRAQRGAGRAAAGPVSGSSRGVDGFTRLAGPRAATPLRDGRSPSRSTPSGVKHPQTCCRAVQIADVAGEQFGAAYRTPGLGLCLQHHHSPAASASIAAATNPLCPTPMTTASTTPLLDGIGVLLLRDHRQPPGVFSAAGRHPEQLQAVR